MCGRYSLIKSEQELAYYYKGGPKDLPGYKPNYNAAPTQTMPVATSEGLELMTWGLVPSWSKEFKPAFTSINARAETVAEKPLYRAPFKKRRALIPATGFYEWQKREAFKQPFYFHLPDRELFSFAGLYDIWYDPAGEPHKSYTIITTTSNKTLSDIHDRMPVILDPGEEEPWLDPSADPNQLQLLLNPYDHAMDRYEVDQAVGNVKNNSEGLLSPLNSK
jgi:putative SOS response-associated peptidase YedK